MGTAWHEAGHAVYAHKEAKAIVNKISLNPPYANITKRDSPYIHLNTLFDLGTTLAGPLVSDYLIKSRYRSVTNLFPLEWMKVYSLSDYDDAIQYINIFEKPTPEESIFIERLVSQMVHLQNQIESVAFTLFLRKELSQEEFLLIVSSSYGCYLKDFLWYHQGKKIWEWMERYLVRFGLLI